MTAITPNNTRKKSTGKIIKHPPALAIGELVKQSTILVSTKTPFVSAYKRASKELERISANRLRRKYVVLVGLGRSMDRVLSLGAKFQDEGHKIEVLTSTKYAVDEVIDEPTNEIDHEGSDELQSAAGEKGEGYSLNKRPVCKVEVRVYTQKS